MYFYAIQIDEPTGKITNFFWANGQSIMDYKCFGDVVSFDTTFHTNKFEMPFAPLLGTSHHKQTIIFGAALMFDETIPSFIWLFETFLTAMGGKQPSTILLIKMQPWQEQLHMYSQIQVISFVCGTFILMPLNILVM
jgi:zinc finger SWIM domain-containing protein 3